MEIIQFWVVMEAGKSVCSAVMVDNADMSESSSSQWAMKTI